MGYIIYKFSNTNGWSGGVETISIKKGDAGWDEAYSKWLQGKNPTDSIEWKKGVVAHTELIPDPSK